MKRVLLGFLVLWAGLASLPAQKITVSEVFGLQNDVAYDILGEWSGQFLLLRDQAVLFQVLGFNQKMEKVWEKTLELDRRRPQILEVINEKRGFSLAYTYWEESSLLLKIHKYDVGANLVDSATVATIGQDIFPVSTYTEISEDRSQLLIYKVEDGGRDIKLYSVSLDSVKLNWERTLSPDGMEFSRDFQQMLVDNDGNMYCILSKDNRKKGNHRYDIYHYGLGLENQYEIFLGDKLTYASRFTYDHRNRQIVAGGLYTDENFSRAMGSFFLRFPLDRPEEVVVEFRELEDVFALALMGKNFNSKNRGISEVALREIVVRKDGGILMIGERERIYQRNLSGGRMDMIGGRFVMDYYLDAMFIISYNPDGSLHWKDIFHKKQYSQDDDGMYSSFLLLKTPSNIRLMFNDEIRHENTVSEYVVSPTGQFERRSVMSTDRQRLRLRFRDAVQISANEAIVPSERRGRLRLVRITY